MKKPKKLLMIGVVVFLAGAASAQQTDPAKPQRIRVAQDVMFSLLTHRVIWQYPEEARAHSITGTATVKLVVDKQGHVAQAEVLSGHPLFVQPALEAVKQWEFKPYLLNGEPVEVETTTHLYFGPPHMLRVSQGVMEGNLIRKVEPIYPAEARAARVQGDVILTMVINREGDVSDLNPISGHPLLAEAAISAVKQWKYKPYLFNGNPVEIESTIKVHFHM